MFLDFSLRLNFLEEFYLFPVGNWSIEDGGVGFGFYGGFLFWILFFFEWAWSDVEIYAGFRYHNKLSG